MRVHPFRVSLLLCAALISGCGGGGGSSTPVNPPGPVGTTVNVTFVGVTLPDVVAANVGGAGFANVILNGNHALFLLPTGTTTYQLAYHCPATTVFGLVEYEYVIEANKSDGITPILSCYGIPATSSMSVAVNASAIAAAATAGAVGTYGYGAYASTANGTATGNFVNGTNDIAALALDASNNLIGVKFVRGQTVPGTINGGNPIVLAASDATTTSTMTVAGIPAGFNPAPAYNIAYVTASGTYFGVNRNTSTYAVVPPANMAAGDAYQFESNDADLATNQHIGATVYASTGGPVTVTLPSPWTYAGPTAAQFPTFTFSYSGFSGTNVVDDRAAIFWQVNPTTEGGIIVYATQAYLAGATTVSIPNLTSINAAFLAPAASGTSVSVISEIDSGEYLSYLSGQQQTTGTQFYVQNDTNYVEP